MLSQFRPLVALLVLTHPAVAETRQHGNLIFTVPTGWTTGGQQEDGTLTLLSDLPDDECEFCYIYISSGAVGANYPDRWLTANAARFVEKDEIDPPFVEPLGPAELFNLKGRPGALLGQKVDGDLQMLFAVQLFGRMELIGFEMPAADEAELAEGMRVFERDVMPMLEKATYVSEGASPLMPPPQPGGRQGLYWGTSTYWTLGLDMMMQMQIDHHWLTFWPDGTFYDGTPPSGIAAFDPAERIEKADMQWGSYKEDGGKLVLSYASGEVEAWEVTKTAFSKATPPSFRLRFWKMEPGSTARSRPSSIPVSRPASAFPAAFQPPAKLCSCWTARGCAALQAGLLAGLTLVVALPPRPRMKLADDMRSRMGW
jgi:hypothetical protein